MVNYFFCNSGLKNSEQSDDSYEEHVRWFPLCLYVRHQLVRPE